MSRNYGRQSLPQDGEWIPSCEPLRSEFIVQREPQALVGLYESTSRSAVKYDAETRVLAFIIYSNPIKEGEIKHLLADYRAREHGVIAFTLLLSNNRDENDWLWLKRKGFFRDESHPLVQSNLVAFSKTYQVKK